MKIREIAKLLKTGKFTIAYHDRGCCTIHKGHIEYDEIPEKEVDQDMPEGICGYIPGEVEMLVEALGGKVVSV